MFRMKGVIPPMITPFKENGGVDYDALKVLVEFLRDKVDGIFAVGSYGGGVLLEEDERMKVAEEVLKTVDGKIPVVVHVGTTNTAGSMRLARHAVANGAAAVSAVGPFYYQHDTDSICKFYEGIKRACQDAPVYLYNNPRFQGYPIKLEVVKKLKEEVGLNGIKDATFDIIEHASYQRLLQDEEFDVALGTEAMWLSACVLGCEAFIPGLGNAFPEICRKMYEEGMKGDIKACRETQFKVNELRDIMYCARSTQIAVYTMLEVRGIVKSYPRSPFCSATEAEKEAIRSRLKQLNMID